jgi:hypothetical protein
MNGLSSETQLSKHFTADRLTLYHVPTNGPILLSQYVLHFTFKYLASNMPEIFISI